MTALLWVKNKISDQLTEVSALRYNNNVTVYFQVKLATHLLTGLKGMVVLKLAYWFSEFAFFERFYRHDTIKTISGLGSYNFLLIVKHN